MKPDNKILLLDDDHDLLESMKLNLEVWYETILMSNVDEAIQYLRSNYVDVVITDLKFENQTKDGLDFINWVNNEKSNIPVIILSGDDNIQRIISAHNRILDDFVIKPCSTIQLRIAIEKALKRAELNKHKKGTLLDEVITQDSAMKSILNKLSLISDSKSKISVYLNGEPGTGKERLARYYANLSGGPFISINMSTIPENLAESILFGHSDDAYTDAKKNTTGLFLSANNGVIFLDEIGDCPLKIQPKLLKALEEREILTLGTTSPVKFTGKVIAATNKNLKEMVKKGEFREDLYTRISAIELIIPPLRERKGDIPLIIAHYLLKMGAEKNQNITITKKALDILVEYDWIGGNIRDLLNTLECSSLSTREIDVQHLPDKVKFPTFELKNIYSNNFESSSMDINHALKALEKHLYNLALEKSNGDKTKAMNDLNVPAATFYRRMKFFNLIT